MKKITLIIVSLILIACNNQQEQAFTSSNFELVKLADGVFACIHKFGGQATCNVGIIDNGEETIIFDTFLSPEVAEEIHEIVARYGLSPIRYIVNSHAHNDHIRGNQAFSEEADIISTKRTAELIHKWEKESIPAEKNYAPPLFAHWDSLYKTFSGDTSSREYANILLWKPYFEVLAESHLKVETRLPNLFVDKQMNLDGPGRRVHLIARGAGHTESDMILFLPDDQIIFTADLVFNEMHPYMGQGDPEAWTDYLDYLETLDFKTLVPGHGRVSDNKEIPTMKAYINDIEKLARWMIENEIPIDKATEISIPESYADWWFENFFLVNLRFMYGTISNTGRP